MSYTLNKEDLQTIEMWLNVIINESKTIRSGNVTHKAANIKGHAIAIKQKLNQPKWKCNRCKDTGQYETEEYRGHTEGIVTTTKKCNCKGT